MAVWTIPSAIVGLIAFIPPAFAAAVAFSATPRGDRSARWAWVAIAAVYTLLSAEAVAMTRYLIIDDLRRWAMHAGVYPERRLPQAMALLILIALVAVIIVPLVRSAPTRSCAIARCATVAVIAVFIGESVSLHALDPVSYGYFGPVRLIGWLWLGCGWTTAAAAVLCAYARQK